jgi:localization factor PodJL
MAEATTRPGKGAPRGTQAFAALAQAKKVVGARRVPFLVGAAVLIAAATTAMYEMRGAHAPLSEKSEFVPAAPATTSPAQPSERKDKSDVKEKPAFDMAPTGSIDAPRAPTAVPTSAPSPKPSPEGPSAASKVSGDLIAAIPDSAPDALRSAAIAGDAGAETELGIRCLEGRTAPRDPKLASRWLELAANQGLPYAEYRLAALYEKGIGGPRDLPLARVWYQKAADAGNARAMHNLAVLNAQDAGAGKPDYGLAAIGFRSAAELGLRDSQFNLGVLYGRGLGVPQDFAQSWMWFSLAAQQGDADAAKKRDEVAARLDAKALAAAAKMYTEFKLKTPLPSANEIPTPPGGWDAKSVTPQAAKPAAPPPTTPAART